MVTALVLRTLLDPTIRKRKQNFVDDDARGSRHTADVRHQTEKSPYSLNFPAVASEKILW